jgi:ATP-dependent DNA ligase
VIEMEKEEIGFQLCEENKEIPKGDYFYQLKLDGERIIAIKKGNDVKLINRLTNSVKNTQYPEIVNELKTYKNDFVIDGEVACMDIHKGLDVLNQRSLQSNPFKIKFLIERIPICYYVFDILEFEGKSCMNLEFMSRTVILANNLGENRHISILDSYRDGQKLFEFVKKENLEGIVAKKKTSSYQFKRNSNWIKIKNFDTMSVDILGYKQDSKRSAFGSAITNRCNVSLLTEKNKSYYFKERPKRALVKHYGIYPSGKLRNPIFLEWCKNV